MLALLGGTLWCGLVLYLLSRALRQFRIFRRAALPAANPSAVLSAVSVIVPVRDEIANIDVCLAGLSAQSGLSGPWSIIVVDDGSEDNTRSAALRHAAVDQRITVVDAGPLPAGWMGKPHACWRGAELAEGEWLCFVDADVRAAPGLVAAAVTAAEMHGTDMLSLQPLQELGSFWERLVIPVGLLVLACAKPFALASPEVVNGQFLLIRREAYFASGGHRHVRAQICEDRALAARLQAQGFALEVLAAEHLARTRMYRDLPSLWEGFSKNATEALGSLRGTLTAAAAALVFGWAALLMPLATLVGVRAEPSPAAFVGCILAFVGTGIVIAVHLGTARHFRIPPAFTATFALGCTAVACLACHAVIRRIEGCVTWKGRTYRLGNMSSDGT
ncbi:MAG: glycosyltransferase family 2 protein [Stellaceae bacterium]|jgi:chlorobactene glucosyltransferase